MNSYSLANQLLIAMPAMADPNFSTTVTYICQHDEDGASGITINRSSGLCTREVFDEIGIECANRDLEEQPVLLGGPVNQQHGFVLHNRDQQQWASSYLINDELALTTSKDILEAMAQERGPQRALFALGYAGWGPGQLEQEMLANSWLSVPAPLKLLFETPLEQRWQRAADQLGVDLLSLTSDIGHA